MGDKFRQNLGFSHVVLVEKLITSIRLASCSNGPDRLYG
jgi:hypothetical protein